MKLSVMLAVVCLLLHSCLVEGQNMTGGGGTLAPGATPAGSAATCYACSATNDTTDACFAAQSGGSVSCPNGVCIVTLVDNADGDPVSIVRDCHSSTCSADSSNIVYTQDTGSGTSYEKCCDNAVDCNSLSADDLRGAAGKLTAGLAAILFGAICLLVL
ncbi:uncharacterized protein LOC144922401 [Branchiostoma floridae x Branchiostoma belcheri]